MDDLFDLLITAVCVLGPVWLALHYRYKSRGLGAAAGTDGAAFERISAVAQAMEQRIIALERILDVESPAWRSQPEAAPCWREAG